MSGMYQQGVRKVSRRCQEVSGWWGLDCVRRVSFGVTSCHMVSGGVKRVSACVKKVLNGDRKMSGRCNMVSGR